jgi:hypothetical protein
LQDLNGSSSDEPRSSLVPVRRAGPDTLRYVIDEEAFAEWSADLNEEDRAGFIAHGGDELLAKFVCAYRYYSARRDTLPFVAMNQAYAAAYDVDAGSYTCRVRCFKAYEHPAVQYLLNVFESRKLGRIKDSILGDYKRLLHKVLGEGVAQDTELRARVAALDATTRFMKMMQTEGNRRKIAALKHPRPIGLKTIEAAVLDLASDAPEIEPTDE